MREDLMKKVRENEDFENLSIDELLRMLIEDSDLTEVVACLDMIAVEGGTRVASFDWKGMSYPSGPEADLKIPAPPWKVDADGIQRLINEDKNVKIFVPVEADDENVIMEDCGCVLSEDGKRVLKYCDAHNEMNKDIVHSSGKIDYPDQGDELEDQEWIDHDEYPGDKNAPKGGDQNE